MRSAGLPARMVLIEAEAPDDFPKERFGAATLPAGWHDAIAPDSTND